jgi:glucose/arabinose dehydrogenase
VPAISRRTSLIAGSVALVVGLTIAVLTRSDEPDVATGRSSTSTTVPTVSASSTTATASTTTTASSTTSTAAPPSTAPSGPPSIALESMVSVSSPSAVVDLDGPGPLLVSTLAGAVLRVDPSSGATEVVLDLTGQVSTGSEQGLLGMAVDPAEERLYVNHTDRRGDTDVRSWPLVDGAPSGGPGAGVVHLELDQPRPNHNGGNLVFGPDGMLWIGTGDGGGSGDPDDVAQDPSSLLGKMLRVDPDPAGGLAPAPGNPAWGGRPEVWGIGLRNPWRYSFDRETGRLWIADVGQSSTEEVSVVDPDAARPDFGWDSMEGDQPFEGSADAAYVAPAVTYRHDAGCSITGGHVYRGRAVQSLVGWYVFGDYCGGWIRAVRADDPSGEQVELLADAGAVLSFAELDDGELLVLTRDGVSRIVSG